MRYFSSNGIKKLVINFIVLGPPIFFGDYGDSLETRTTAMIKTRRFLVVNGRNVAFNFPKRLTNGSEMKNVQECKSFQIYRSSVYENTMDSKDAGCEIFEKGGFNLCYLIPSLTSKIGILTLLFLLLLRYSVLSIFQFTDFAVNNSKYSYDIFNVLLV